MTSTQEQPQENSTEAKKRYAKYDRKKQSKYYNPCEEAAQRSIKCMHRNGGDKALCSDYFDAYKECKKEWTMDRRKQAPK